MADKTPEQEPSIEEILASIRQIISDDDDKEPAPAPTPEPIVVTKPQAPPLPQTPMFETKADLSPEPEDDILELSQPLIEDEPEEDDEEEVFEIDLQEHEPDPEPEIVDPKPVTPRTKMEPVMDDILTDAARNATISSMARLAGNMPVTRHRDYGNITLEDLVREMLHPMLKDWLSESLPPMVERMVQRELEKLARASQDV